MRVQPKTRNHMPVHVWHHISETGEIDFLRFEKLALRLFNGKHNAHQVSPFRLTQISHFARVPLHDDATETRMVFVVYVDHTPQRVRPDDFATRFPTEYATVVWLVHFLQRYNKTRSIPPRLACLTYCAIQSAPSRCLAISTTM